MTQPQVATATMTAVRELAGRALSLPDGLDVAFTVARYGSPEVCESMARSFSNAFSSMRARARRQDQRASGERLGGLLTTIRGPYDDLACQNLPDGHGGRVIKLRKSKSIVYDMDVSSGGKPLEDFSPDIKMFNECLDLLSREEQHIKRCGGAAKDPLPEDAREWFWERSPWKDQATTCYQFYGIPLPGPRVAFSEPFRPNDAANASLEDMEDM